MDTDVKATTDAFEEEDPLETLQQKHRKEKKDLQVKIQTLKKSVGRNDKKKKKEIMEEILRLEADLAQKQEAETSELKTKHGLVESKKPSETEDALLVHLKNGLILNEEKKMNKAQRRRARKNTQLKERELRILEQDAKNLDGARHVETEQIKEILKSRNLMIDEVPSDGNCLYSAALKRLKQLDGYCPTVQEVRLKVGEFLLENKQEFLPYLSHPDTGNMLTNAQYTEYCDQVANTTAWGGEIELRALSHVLKRPIEVIQAKGPSVVAGMEYEGKAPAVVLTYHRHMYGLGEHYNSVTEYVEDKDKDGFQE